MDGIINEFFVAKDTKGKMLYYAKKPLYKANEKRFIGKTLHPANIDVDKIVKRGQLKKITVVITNISPQ